MGSIYEKGMKKKKKKKEGNPTRVQTVSLLIGGWGETSGGCSWVRR